MFLRVSRLMPDRMHGGPPLKLGLSSGKYLLSKTLDFDEAGLNPCRHYPRVEQARRIGQTLVPDANRDGRDNPLTWRDSVVPVSFKRDMQLNRGAGVREL
jgi:hypothetical protein